MQRTCDNCGKEYIADQRNISRGWGLCCSKSCAAAKREISKPTYNSNRVEFNNIRRSNWNGSVFDWDEGKHPYSYDGANEDQWGDCEFGIHE